MAGQELPGYRRRLDLRCREAIAPNRPHRRAPRQCEAQGLPWVIRVGLTEHWRLPLYAAEQTFFVQARVSEKCQKADIADDAEAVGVGPISTTTCCLLLRA